MSQSSNKTIAKNTIFLYFRMLVTMIISLYTSRVILQVLGVDDFGIYQAVGGIVGMLSFINGSLSTGSSRFITFGLGEGDDQKLKRIFGTTLTAHVLLAALIVLLAETAGLWYLYNKMVIAPDRMSAAIVAFHLSIVTSFFTIVLVPYSATIIAHERMSVYAYVSIVEAVLKLLIVCLLKIGDIDKLVLYSILLCLTQVGINLFYIFYCTYHFSEVNYKFSLDKSIFKEVASFSGWSLFANGAIALNNQGILLLLNLFFAPAVVSARAISLQVNMAANQLVNSFRTAVTPQIVKKYAIGDYEGSKKLLLSSTKYSYYLMYALSLPICLLAYPLLHLWLGVVPEYTTIFLQLIVIQSLFQVFDSSFYNALYAKGQLRENALISPTLLYVSFPLIYLLFKAGFSPVALSWATMMTYGLLGSFVKPMLIIRIVNYNWKEILGVFKPCLFVTIVSLPIPVFFYHILDVNNNFWHDAILLIITLFTIALSVWFIGLDKDMRVKVFELVKKCNFSLGRL